MSLAIFAFPTPWVMEVDSETTRSSKEEGNLVRSTKRSKGMDEAKNPVNGSEGTAHRPSYLDKVRGTANPSVIDMEGMEEDDDASSDDDVVENLGNASLFSMGMSRQEKIATRCPRRAS